MATASKSTKTAAAKVEDLAADTQKMVTEQFDKATKGFEEISEFSQKNVDALVKSSEVAAKAAEGMNAEYTAFAKKSFDESVAAAKDFAASKTVSELVEKQTAFAQSYFEGFVAQSTKMNEMFAAAAKDMTAPVTERMTAATEMVKTYNA
ncbi:phasin family protein [Oceanomicrobium pacificus]|uniref:TIGR01841 family phasin n=1 Tax=Oceanomicrobium pacificus TaxID=2692916 RepID=A0A6B0TZZ6_9RHOB|nr:phasin family protein [Oceanomicrobium pacificus]MXU66822.1 TIGR01841 family phasin [Oceanomicrobium pacificus]